MFSPLHPTSIALNRHRRLLFTCNSRSTLYLPLLDLKCQLRVGFDLDFHFMNLPLYSSDQTLDSLLDVLFKTLGSRSTLSSLLELVQVTIGHYFGRTNWENIAFAGDVVAEFSTVWLLYHQCSVDSQM
ncbi:hypothetical protein PPTG_23433 [Phytophthora nicotianae INRA-310]|uniref:Uncharacterized protein n=1 Tax=Phytophthora nicotianae (strain INRA-310) TaxID=761204 RepID=W2PYS8_PHYN3|nr:hypothetical protein PPTG_23433 [Phytophthora nicotianae INRA-310]ETN05776.1 hypothetical protein PPTG_23433 [Phytophthora nicotianae INRA-310]